MVPLLNKEKRIYMGVWAAGTGITRNGATPNYAFRVSAVDALVDVRLLAYAHKKFAAKKAGLMLINNPWGQSHEKGLVAAGKVDPSIEIAGIEKFENNDVDMVPQLARLKDAGADAIILVVNAPPGAQVMKSRERMGWTAPVVSHWGISGGRFPELAGPTAGEAHFIQTYSFFGKQGPVGQRVLAGLMKKYPQIKGPEDVFAPVGTANAYDAMHILALGIAQAGSTDGDAIRSALEDLKTPYEGLIKTYARPFTAENHDALGPDNYISGASNGTFSAGSNLTSIREFSRSTRRVSAGTSAPPNRWRPHSVIGCSGVFCRSWEQLHSTQVCGVSPSRA